MKQIHKDKTRIESILVSGLKNHYFTKLNDPNGEIQIDLILKIIKKQL